MIVWAGGQLEWQFSRKRSFTGYQASGCLPKADVEASPFRYSKTVLLHHVVTGLRHGLPLVGYGVIEADQLQYLFVLFGEHYIHFLSQGYKAWLLPQILEDRIVKRH